MPSLTVVLSSKGWNTKAHSPNPTALLHRWYTLVREKRTSRQDFLKTVGKAFDLDSTNLASTQDDVDFIRYMAENLSAFDYKTQEEVLTVIRHLTSVLSVVGMALVETISPTTLNDHPHVIPPSTPLPNSNIIPSISSPLTPRMSTQNSKEIPQVPGPAESDMLGLARCSVVVGIILILKSHLKSLYGLTDDKCSKWVPGKKSAMGDRPATKRREIPLEWDRMSYATQAIRTERDAALQKERFLELWIEDPVMPEPEDDPMDLQ